MRKKRYYLTTLLVLVSSFIWGCSFNSNSDSTGNAGGTTQSPDNNSSKDAAIVTDISESQVVVDKEFTARDLEVGYEESTATMVTFQGDSMEVSGKGASINESVLTINKEGTYVITGTLIDGQIIVDVGDNDKVQIVLNGVTIHCQNQAPIYIKNADKVFITLKEDTVNELSDGSEYVQGDESTVDGVIFSKGDLTINGEGTLNITANYKHGILSKDSLTITGGTYNITAVKDAINGKDAVKIKDGNFTLSSTTGIGIQSKHDEDVTKGYVYISGGNISVTNCQEGIEGTVIIIEDGTIDIMAQDDGMNASSGITTSTSATTQELKAVDGKDMTELLTATLMTSDTTDKSGSDSTVTDNNSTQDKMGRGDGFGGGFGGDFGGGEMENNTNCYISISGGTISINASGDGIDSNGSIFISGGSIYVNGPTSGGDGGLDYNGSAQITGGNIIVVGSIGMAQGFSETSTQYSILHNLSTVSEAGTEVSLTDAKDNVITSFTPSKQYQSIVISTPELVNGATYKLTAGNQTEEITLSSVVTSNGAGGMGFPNGMGGKPNKGQMTDPGEMQQPSNK